jgi:hypothetical protein
MVEIERKRNNNSHREATLRLEINSLKNEISATKDWKPERRIVIDFHSNYHTVDKDIAKIEALTTCPSLPAKVVQVIRLRKAVMEEMNKARSNPMRNIHINIVLTPMDYKADCSWTITRYNNTDAWTYTHFLHRTEYNLVGADVIEYRSRELIMSEAEKKEAEEKKKRLSELKKTPHANYFKMWCDDISRATSTKVKNEDMTMSSVAKYDLDTLVKEADMSKGWNGKPYNPIFYYIATDVNYETHTFTLIGYLNDKGDFVKSDTPLAIVYPAPKTKRTKTTQLQKDAKPLMMDTEVNV